MYSTLRSGVFQLDYLWLWCGDVKKFKLPVLKVWRQTKTHQVLMNKVYNSCWTLALPRRPTKKLQVYDDTGDLGGAMGDMQHTMAWGRGAAWTKAMHHHCEGAIIHTAGDLVSMVYLSLHLLWQQKKIVDYCCMLQAKVCRARERHCHAYPNCDVNICILVSKYVVGSVTFQAT